MNKYTPTSLNSARRKYHRTIPTFYAMKWILYGWSAYTTGISGWVRCIPYISKPQLICDKGGMLRHAPALPHATIKPREIRPCGRRTAAYNYVVSGRRIFSNENGFSDCMPTGDVCDPSGGGEGNSAGSWFNVSLSFIFSIAGVT